MHGAVCKSVLLSDVKVPVSTLAVVAIIPCENEACISTNIYVCNATAHKALTLDKID